MPEHDMEDIFRKKLADFAPAHNDRWEQIASTLPTEKNKRKALWIWFAVAGACLILGIIGINLIQTDNLVDQATQNPTAQVDVMDKEPNVSASSNTEEAPINNQLEMTEPGEVTNAVEPETENPTLYFEPRNKGTLKTGSNSLKNEPGKKPIEPVPQQAENPHKPSKEFAEAKEVIDPTAPLERKEELVVEAPEEPENSESTIETPTQANESNPEPLPIAIGTQPNSQPNSQPQPHPHPWSFGIGAGAYQSLFIQKMPKNPGNTYIEKQGMVARNRDLREAMEQGGSAFSQSIWVDYKPFEHWSFSTGISMLQTTQNLAFNVQNVFDDSIRGPQHFPEGGSNAVGGQYIFVNDSILPGNTATASNKYFAREIPLYINYHHKLNDKISVQASVGMSYRWVRSASVYMADIDNIGIIRLDGPENYPGIRSTFQIQGGLGINYHFNEYFALQVMPSFSYSIQSNIRFTQYVQQYQHQWGLQLKLTRNLDF